MYDFKKKLLTMACIAGMIGLGYVSPARAFEPKIPVDGKVIEQARSYDIQPHFKYELVSKTLESGVDVRDIDYGIDGKIDVRLARQQFPDGRIMLEVDFDADNNIEQRITLNSDNTIRYEEQQPDGSVLVKVVTPDNDAWKGLLENLL